MKHLSELLEEIESISSDRPEFEKLRSVAIELAKAIEHLEEANRRLINWEFAEEPYVKIAHEYKNQLNQVIKEVNNRAKEIIGGESE